jgi:hypothetical protein
MLFHGTVAQAQFAVNIMPSIIGGTIAGMGGGDPETACMLGAQLPDSEIAEARDPSVASMLQYFVAAQGGGLKSGAFHLDEKTRLTVGASNGNSTNLDTIPDPLATDGRILLPKALRFYRSFLRGMSLGQWAVLDARGSTVGVYTGLFVRKGGTWKLRDLSVSMAGEKVKPAMAFCRTPGDVVPFKVTFTLQAREQTEKRLAKARTRLETTTRQAEASKAAKRAQLASMKRVDAIYAAKDVAKLETMLADAIKAENEALDDARSVDRLTVDAGNAMLLANTT